MNKYLALQKDVFDISKVIVVGSPTITSDGVASGFSSSNYLTSQTSIVLDNTISFCFKFRILTNKTTTGAIFNCFNNFKCLIYYHKKGHVCMHLDHKTYVDSATLDDNAVYDVECGYNHLSGEMYIKTTDLNGNTEINNTAAPNTFSRNISAITYGWQNGVGEGNFSGSIYMNTVKIEKNNQLIYTLTKPTYLLERRKPKVWNKGQFTMVGNPSISDEGIASGFSQGNYIKIPKFDISKGFVIQEKFRCNSVVGSQTILSYTVGETSDTRFGVIAYFESNGKLSVNTTSNGTSFAGHITSTTTILPNVDYILKLEYDGTKITMYLSSDNGITFIQEASKNIVLYNGLEAFKLGTGAVSTNTNSFINGSINLKSIKIYTNNTLVFDGGAETYVYDPSKFTVVGSPTITEYGVASGFSANNYIIIPNYIANKDNFKITGKWICGAINETILGLTGQGWGSVLRIWDGNRGLVCGLTNTSLSTNSGNCVIGRAYDFSIEYQNNSLILGLSTDGENFVYVSATEQTLNAFVNSSANIYIGVIADHKESLYMQGSINLPSFSITVDGVEVFTGAKENYYMLRR